MHSLEGAALRHPIMAWQSGQYIQLGQNADAPGLEPNQPLAPWAHLGFGTIH